MDYSFCPYCRAYTPPEGDRCAACGMVYPYRSPLSDAISEVRSDALSSYSPIRVRPARGKTLRFSDGRSSKPYFAKLSYGGEGEYVIMDENSLKAMLGPDFVQAEDGIVRRDGKKLGQKVTVSYTRRDYLIPSLNRRSGRSI